MAEGEILEGAVGPDGVIRVSLPDRRDPKQIWEETDRVNRKREEKLRAELLDRAKNEGESLSRLVNTPGGKVGAEKAEEIVKEIVNRTLEGKKPTISTAEVAEDAQEVAFRRGVQEALVRKWDGIKTQRATELLSGGGLNNIEGYAYLGIVDPKSRAGETGATVDQVKIDEFQRTLNQLAAARFWAGQEGMPVDERSLPQGIHPSEVSLRFHGVTGNEVKASFANGWNNIKSESTTS